MAPSAAPPRSALLPRERRLVARLDSPLSVQRWLDSLPYNHERDGPTIRSFRRVAADGTAHCLEGALAAAAILEHHGHPPRLLDLESEDLLDHVLFLFRTAGRYGAVATSRYPGLRGRRAVFRSVQRLAASYVDPFVDATGRVTAYATFDLGSLPRRIDWRFSMRNLWSVERALIDYPHRPLPTSDARHRRLRRWYLGFKEANPGREPDAYRGMHTWM